MAQVKVEQVSFCGWHDAWKISNPVCEMIVVPSLCRVMSLAWTGGPNLLWVSPDAAGQTFPTDDRQWHNLGGDKVWPAEQSRWLAYTGRKRWPPPHAFDSGVGRVEPIPGGLRLISPVDPDFGAVCVREFVLDPVAPRVRLHQYFDKHGGPVQKMTFWTITQVAAPTLALLPPGAEQDGSRYCLLSDGPFLGTFSEQSGVALHTLPRISQKVGILPEAAQENGWVAATFAVGETLLVESHALEAEGAYPDGNCQAELYADAGVNGPYVEMELLSPERAMAAGERLTHDEVWQLVRLPSGAATDPLRAVAAARQAHAQALSWLRR